MSITVSRFDRFRFSIVSSGFSTAVRDAAKSTPGMVPEFENGKFLAWVGYVDAVDAVCRKLDSKNIRYDAEVLAADRAIDNVAKAYAGKSRKVNYEGAREYQRPAIDFLLREGPSGALLAMDMRLGKSLCALRAAEAIGQRTLIACPSHVVGVWSRSLPTRPCELERWWPAGFQKLAVLEGTKPDLAILEGAQVAVIHYDILHAWTDTVLNCWDQFVFIPDEGHAFQSERSRRSQSAERLRAQASYVFMLSGTPMTNRPRDLYSVCNVLSPGRFGSNFFNYGMAFCNGHQKTVGKGSASKTVYDFDGKSNEDELRKRLSFFMLRITKSDVATELPPKTRQIIPIEIPKRNRLFIAPENLQDKKLARKLLDASADGALPQAIAVLEEHLEQGHKVVAFTHRRAVAEHLANSLALKNHQAEIVHGQVAPRKRDDRIEILKNSEKPGVLCATIESAGTGIDLSFADVIVFVELTWEPHEVLQAEERVFKLGKMDPILIQFLVPVGTVAELVIDKLIAKLETIDHIIGGAKNDRLQDDLRGKQSGEEALRELCAGLMKAAGEKKSRKVK
jgi:SWI/SNF-related matrix-associated actin-dependent regulator 1 of chromatin subfamily A